MASSEWIGWFGASKSISDGSNTRLASNFLPDAADTYDLGSASLPWRNAYLGNDGLHLWDTNGTHYLIVAPGSNLTADRTLTVTTGDADRTITLSGNPTLADWFDQSVKAGAAPSLAVTNLTGTLPTAVQDVITRTGTLVSGATGVGYTLNLNASTITNAATSWTPGITFGGGSTGMTFSSRGGSYFQIGKLVVVQAFMSLSAKGSSTGGALLTGLPLAIANVATNYTALGIWGTNFGASVLSLSALGNINTTTAFLYSFTSGTATQLTHAEFLDSTQLSIMACYVTT